MLKAVAGRSTVRKAKLIPSIFLFFLPWLDSQQWPIASSMSKLHDHRHATFSGTTLVEWSVWHRDLYLTKHNTQKRQICMSLAGFESSIPASERPKTHSLDFVSTGLGHFRRFPTFFFCRDSVQWARASSFTRILDYTQRHTTVGRTPLDERSTRRIDLYLTTHNTHNRQTSMPPVGFEPTISAGERP